MILSVGATFAADDVALNDASDGMAGGSDALGIAVDTEAVGAGTAQTPGMDRGSGKYVDGSGSQFTGTGGSFETASAGIAPVHS